IVCVFTGTGMQTYINGSADPSSFTFPNSTVDWTSPLGQYIGGNPYDDKSWVNGKIDQLRIYNRALSANEVLQLYNRDAGLVGNWKMDESSWTNDCSTPTVMDSSGNGNDGRACPNGTGPSGGVVGRIGKA